MWGAGGSRKHSQAEGAAYANMEVRQSVESSHMGYRWEGRGLSY